MLKLSSDLDFSGENKGISKSMYEPTTSVWRKLVSQNTVNNNEIVMKSLDDAIIAIAAEKDTLKSNTSNEYRKLCRV